MIQDTRRLHDLQAVYRTGGRFVLLHPGRKRPAWKGWLTCRRPTPPTIAAGLDRGLGLGIVPGSLYPPLAVVDVDDGEPVPLWRRIGSPGVTLHLGRHGVFDALPGLGKRPFRDLGGCHGDVIQDSGYIQLHEGYALGLLAATLGGWWVGVAPLQFDLFTPATVQGKKKKREKRTGPKVDKVEPSSFLEEVLPGSRNDSLFDVVRNAAYARWSSFKGGPVEPWMDWCEEYALDQNRRFPVPLPEPQVCSTAASVATWTRTEYQGSGFKPYDHSPEAQRRKIVKRWHGNARQWTLDQLERRNREIVLDYKNGVSVADLAEHWGLSTRHVYRLLPDISL